MTRPLTLTIAAMLFSGSIVQPVCAADWHDYAGTWTITGSAIAPWVETVYASDQAESRRLTGKSVTFAAQRVAGPSPLGCAKPVYKVDVVGPDMIFEGMLAEKRGASPGGIDAADKSATQLGFADPKHIATLDAGCTEIQFHQLQSGVLVFGLNNRVYKMSRK